MLTKEWVSNLAQLQRWQESRIIGDQVGEETGWSDQSENLTMELSMAWVNLDWQLD